MHRARLARRVTARALESGRAVTARALESGGGIATAGHARHVAGGASGIARPHESRQGLGVAARTIVALRTIAARSTRSEQTPRRRIRERTLTPISRSRGARPGVHARGACAVARHHRGSRSASAAGRRIPPGDPGGMNPAAVAACPRGRLRSYTWPAARNRRGGDLYRTADSPRGRSSGAFASHASTGNGSCRDLIARRAVGTADVVVVQVFRTNSSAPTSAQLTKSNTEHVM
jgi:hypothetical protein